MFSSAFFLQGLAFLPKTECNVREVEIAVGLLLTKTAIEPVSFKVPRVKVSQVHHLVDTWEHCAQHMELNDTADGFIPHNVALWKEEEHTNVHVRLMGG